MDSRLGCYCNGRNEGTPSRRAARGIALVENKIWLATRLHLLADSHTRGDWCDHDQMNSQCTPLILEQLKRVVYGYAEEFEVFGVSDDSAAGAFNTDFDRRASPLFVFVEGRRQLLGRY